MAIAARPTSEGTSLETLTWAAGLLAATRELVVFGTVHVPLINPIFAAKQCITADQIGQGRFGLNIVSGWNAGEFEMFGVQLLEHDERYAYSEEWAAIVKRVWTEREPFDFTGKYFNLKGVMIKPKPYGDGRPLLLSAGSSRAGPPLLHATPIVCLWWWLTRKCAPRNSRACVNGGRPVDRGLCQWPRDLPPDREGDGRILPLHRRRDGRLGCGRPHGRYSPRRPIRSSRTAPANEGTTDQRHRDLANDRRP